MATSEDKIREASLTDFPEHEYFEADYARHHQVILQEIIDAIASRQCRKILDIGPATGVMYDKLPQRENYQIAAAEIIADFFPALKKRGIEPVLCDVNEAKLPFDDNIFDAVVYASILEHTLKPKENIDEIHRVLAPGGVIILSAPNAMSLSRRWNYLRGRNPFWTLIDNLISQIGYLKRCSIFYSADNIRYLLHDKFDIKRVSFIDEDSYEGRKKSVVMRLICLLQRLMPRYREVILIVAEKK